jgi:hypothetical protein
MKRIAAIAAILILTVVILIPFGMWDAFAEPVVLKDSSRGIGVEEGGSAPERDRSLQDGALIYGMTPVYPEDIKEGIYDAEALSSSQFFKITDAKLDVKDGHIKAIITLSSTSYACIYPGTAAEAGLADRSEWIAADESSGFGQFRIEAEALNKEMPCAAYSKKKNKWYDRDIVFLASSLPADAIQTELNEDGGTIEDTRDAAVKVIYIALAIIIVGGIANHFVKKRYYE